MKKQISLFSRFALATITAGALACPGLAFAQGESTTYAPDPADRTGSAQDQATAGELQPQEKAFNSTAGIGAKPSKAELAKQKAAGANQNATGAVAVATNDQQFMTMAAKDGMKEVNMGQMAAEKGQSDEVKKLGSQIAADHTKANTQLTNLATKKGVKLDTRFKMDKMSKKDMENFDQSWLAMMVMDHEKDIKAYETQAKTGTDPELKAWAGKTVPVLKNHLKMVKAAQGKMAKKSS